MFDTSGLDGPPAGALDSATSGRYEAGPFDARSDESPVGTEASIDAPGGVGQLDAADDLASNDTGTVDEVADAVPDEGGVDVGGPDAGSFDAGSLDAGSFDAGGGDAGGLGAGLVAYYPFDETSGTTSLDASGHNQTATMQGASFSRGLRGNAATMSGSGQYVLLPAAIVSGLTSFSISTWVYSNNVLPHTRVFDFGVGTNAYMFLTPDTTAARLTVARFAITTNGVGSEQRVDGPRFAMGSWQHVAVTLAGGTGTTYINGVGVGRNTSMTLNPSSLGNTTQNWIGRSQDSADPYLNGQIDELRIYNRALSATEVQQLFQQR